MRSANDGSDEVGVYQQRAHGFIPKVPLRQGGGGSSSSVSEMIAPLWIKRFGIIEEEKEEVEVEVEEVELQTKNPGRGVDGGAQER